MKRNLQNLANNHFDLLVIGGGITGACVAHDAALRGLRVALVEKGDFGGYTSSASSKLLHSGIRYLPKLQLWKVRESARETAIFNHIAPHIPRWIPFLIPTDEKGFMSSAPAMHLAMQIYSLCRQGVAQLIDDPSKRAPREFFLPVGQAVYHAPSLKAVSGLTGAQILWESHMFSSERMTLAFIKSAVSCGAEVANYLEVKELLLRGDTVQGARVEDRLSGESFDIQAGLTLNAAGPYVSSINDSVPELKLTSPLTGFSKGVHLVTRQIEPEYAMALKTKKKTEGLVTRGGRHFFIIPWRGCSLIGTADVPYEEPLDAIGVTARDIEEFLGDINSTLPELQLEETDVRYAFPGIYPLIASNIKADTYQGTGHYQVIDHGKNSGIHGIITALGAKYTTARHVAEIGVNMVFAKLGKADPGCATRTTRVSEGKIDNFEEFFRECSLRYRQLLDEDVLGAMIHNHGCHMPQLVERGQQLDTLKRISPERETLEVEVEHAVREEMTMTLEDLFFQRTGMGTIGDPGTTAVNRCLTIMADLLDWNSAEQERQKVLLRRRYTYS